MIPPWLRLLRPHQWSKNLACFAGVLFGGHLGQGELLWRAAGVFLVFSAASSAVYTLNDLLDRRRDRLHPKKRNRPIASGAVSPTAAAALALVLAGVAAAGGVYLGPPVLVLLGLYAGNGVLYSVGFKHLVLVDVQSIALGFVLRLLAGIMAIGEQPTAWIVICLFFLANFLGFAKRRAELATAGEDGAAAQRGVLASYSLPFLDGLVASSGGMAVISYALFTLLSGRTPALIATLPFVYYGVARYKFLLYVKGQGEEPESLLLRDFGIQAAVGLWVASFLALSYWHPALFR